jgi:hypothetical protein
VGAGVVLSVCMAGVAFAGPTAGPNPDNGDPTTGVEMPVQVKVDCGSEGALSMEVDDSLVVLQEVTAGVPAGERWFSETTGEVTVTDTRCVEQIDEDVHWWVEGTASDFVDQAGVQQDITAEHLGWEPKWADPSYTGMVSTGFPVDSALDNGTGVVGREMMFEAGSDSNDEELLEEGQWTAVADLLLKVDDTVGSGTYDSNLTLTLFEYSNSGH